MNIIRLSAENVKRLKAVRIEPTGAVITVGGRNAQGKSSVLDAINMALGGKNAVPARPIRDGEKKAQIVLETQEIIVTRRFTASGTTSLEVTNKEGQIYKSPQDVLDKLTAAIAFDPLAFVRDGETPEGRRRQLARVRDLAGVDTVPMEVKKRGLVEQRKDLNRRVKEQEALVQSLPLGGPERVDTEAVLAEMAKAEESNLALAERERELRAEQQRLDMGNDAAKTAGDDFYRVNQALASAKKAHAQSQEMHAQATRNASGTALIDTNALREALAAAQKALQDAQEHNDKRHAAMEAATRLEGLAKVQALRVEQAEKTLAEAKNKADALALDNIDQQARVDRAAEALVLMPPVTDIGKYRQILREAEQTNAQAAKVEQRKAEAEKLTAISKEADELTDQIEVIDAERTALISAGKMPIPDLGFGEEGVLYRGVPLEQASSAEQLRVGLAIAIAANPKLKVMLIRDGSLLDEDSLKIVRDMAEAAEAQVWMEVVTTDKGRCTVVIEDGEIAYTAP